MLGGGEVEIMARAVPDAWVRVTTDRNSPTLEPNMRDPQARGDGGPGAALGGTPPETGWLCIHVA